MSSRWLRNSFIYLLILVAVVAIVFSFFQPSGDSQEMDIGTLLDNAKQGRVEKIEVSGDTLTVHLKNDERVYKSRKETGASILELLERANVPTGQPDGVAVDIKAPSQFGNWLGILVNFLPLIIFGAILLFMMRQAQGSNSQAMSFGKSRARMFTGNRPTVTFADESVAELAEVSTLGVGSRDGTADPASSAAVPAWRQPSSPLRGRPSR